MPQVMVISSEGYFYSYNIDLENGGECSLMKQYRCVPISQIRVSLCPFQCPKHLLFSLLDSNDEKND